MTTIEEVISQKGGLPDPDTAATTLPITMNNPILRRRIGAGTVTVASA